MATTTSPAGVGAAADAGRRAGIRVARPSLLGVVAYVILVLVAAAILIPILYAVLGGFKTNGQMAADPGQFLPNPWVLENYQEVLVGAFAPTFWGELWNSLVIAVIAVVIAVVFASMAAFVFARMQFRGREALFTLFVFGLLFPTAVAILPLFILIRQLGLTGTPARRRPAPGGVRAAADDRDPAAVLPEHPGRARGCRADRRLQLVRVLLAGPAAARAARPGDGQRPRGRGRRGTPSSCRWSCSTAPSQWTLPLGAQNFSTQFSSDQARILAYTVVGLIPAIVFYAIAERQLVGGLTSGAVKG